MPLCVHEVKPLRARRAAEGRRLRRLRGLCASGILPYSEVHYSSLSARPTGVSPGGRQVCSPLRSLRLYKHMGPLGARRFRLTANTLRLIGKTQRHGQSQRKQPVLTEPVITYLLLPSPFHLDNRRPVRHGVFALLAAGVEQAVDQDQLVLSGFQAQLFPG